MKHRKRLKYLILGLFLIICSFGIFRWMNPIQNTDKRINVYHDLKSGNSWESGPVRHLLPSFDHKKLLIKTSFFESQEASPLLKVNDQIVKGEKNDPRGRFWQFYYEELLPDTRYQLQILTSDQLSQTDPWFITSFPHPDSSVANLKVLTYTCAGGVEDKFLGKDIFISINARQELLKKALSHDPQIVIANGDHIYWDQLSFKTSTAKKLLSAARDRKYGTLDLDQSMLSDQNYDIFTRLANAQIADLYGCYLREQSVYFVTDDHDLLENDEALPELVTLPPAPYMLEAARTTQKLYYPELNSPPKVKTGLVSEQRGLSASFGHITFGALASFSLYDCKRFCSLDNDEAVLIPIEVEEWITNGILDSTSRWQFQVPSSPFGWTAGKWSEWYPDVLNKQGELVTSEVKYLWPKGWWNQHQRIVHAMSQSKRPSIIIQGDLHMAGFGLLERSGEISASISTINLIAGPPLGSGTMAFPSAFRGTGSKIPQDLEVKELSSPSEKNGFTLLDISQDRVKIEMYTWRPPELITNIQSLSPTFTHEIKY